MTRNSTISTVSLATLLAGGLALSWLALHPQADVAAKSAAGKAITGEVKFVGTPPKIRKIDRSSEPTCENGTAYNETVLVIDGKLANVHVGAVSGTMGKHKAPSKAVIVNQADCLYVPRMQGGQAGQEIHVTNGDRTMHNVHARRAGSTWLNKSQPAKSPALVIESGKAGETIKLGCDVHRWMKAFVPITDHPYFDVSGRDGKFEIPNVPIGKTIKLRAWHETLGEQIKEVKAGDHVVFTFM